MLFTSTVVARSLGIITSIITVNGLASRPVGDVWVNVGFMGICLFHTKLFLLSLTQHAAYHIKSKLANSYRLFC